MAYQYRNDSVPGYIYLVEAVGYHGKFPGCYLKRCKIGLTRDVNRRLSEFESNQPPCDIELIKSIYVEDMQEVEAYLHKKYKFFNVRLAKSREWFDVPLPVIQSIKFDMRRLQKSDIPPISVKGLVAIGLVVAGLSAGVVSNIRYQMNYSQVNVGVKK